MKVTAVLGSPRPSSNSTFLADKVLLKAMEKGMETKRFVLNSLRYKGCQACGSCKGKTERCVIKDDLADVLSAVENDDFLILTSPIYIGDVNGQTKSFFDRLYSFLTPDFYSNPNPSRLKPGKKLLFITSQAQPENVYGPALKRYTDFFNNLGFNVEHFMAAGLSTAPVAENRADLVAAFEERLKSLL